MSLLDRDELVGMRKLTTKTVQGQTSDTLPHIGPIPGKEGQFIIAGFNGHGMPLIHLSAKGIVEMMIEGKEFGETGVPKLFETTVERLAVKSGLEALKDLTTRSFPELKAVVDVLPS